MTRTLALVLGGGGSRGLAHLGVLEVLEREGIPIGLIVGTSMGAIVGAMYAYGLPVAGIAQRLETMQGLNMFGGNVFTARGRQASMSEQLAKELNGIHFEELKIPLLVTAVDMVSGQEVVLQHGSVVSAVLASSAVPVVFPPVELNGMQLMDGGVIDSVCTEAAYQRGWGVDPAKPILAVDVYPPLSTELVWADPFTTALSVDLPFDLPFSNTVWAKTPGAMAALWRSFRVLAWYVHERRLAECPPQVLLRPELGSLGSLDFGDMQMSYTAGVQAAEAQLETIKALLRTADGAESQDSVA